MARSVFGRLKAEGERIALPNECEENDRAVRFLAKEMGVGHYDNINLLIMAVLFIFVAVAFLAVNGGKAGSSRMKAVTKESLMNGEFTTELEKSYMDQLPIPDEIKRANEVVSLLYGFGNKLTSTKHRSFSTGNDNSGTSQNVFDRDDDDKDHKENAVTMGTQTDENGNVMTTEEVVKTAPGGGIDTARRDHDHEQGCACGYDHHHDRGKTRPFGDTVVHSVNHGKLGNHSGAYRYIRTRCSHGYNGACAITARTFGHRAAGARYNRPVRR